MELYLFRLETCDLAINELKMVLGKPPMTNKLQMNSKIFSSLHL